MRLGVRKPEEGKKSGATSDRKTDGELRFYRETNRSGVNILIIRYSVGKNKAEFILKYRFFCANVDRFFEFVIEWSVCMYSVRILEMDWWCNRCIMIPPDRQRMKMMKT